MEKPSCTESYRFTWSREATTSLIELYEEFPCLYQVASKDYINKNKRTAAIDEITAAFNKRNLTTLSSKMIQGKIHGLRTQFMAELNKIKKSKVSGAGVGDVYEAKLWCFGLLQFILQGGSVTQGDSNLNKSQALVSEQKGVEESDVEVMVEPDLQLLYEGDIEGVEQVVLSPVQSLLMSEEEATSCETTPRTQSRAYDNPPKKRKRSAGKSDDLHSLIESATCTLRSLRNEPPETNRHVLFAQYIAAELDSIKDEEIVDNVKQQISTIVYKAKEQYRQKK